MVAVSAYLASAFLDEVDGRAARALGQSKSIIQCSSEVHVYNFFARDKLNIT